MFICCFMEMPVMTASPDPQPTAEFLGLGRSILQSQIAKVEALRGAGADVEVVLAHARRIWRDDRAWVWAVAHHAGLGAASIGPPGRGGAGGGRGLPGRIEDRIAAWPSSNNRLQSALDMACSRCVP